MKKRIIIGLIVIMVLCIMLSKAQVIISTGTYNQNFGTSSLASWTDNVTILGWYISNSASPQWGGELNITSAAPTNTGKNYAYTCNGGSDRKIGTRASGGSGTCYFGVLMQNQTGIAIQSFLVTFTAFQMSRGGNTSANPNTLVFEYIISASPIAVNAAGGTPVGGLAYTQTQFTTTASTSSQTEGFPCTVFEVKSACINASLPNNSYILFRWVDADDPANDPHFAVDDLSVAFDLTGATCTNFLPVELLGFEAKFENDKVDVSWSTATEHNSDLFAVERSSDAVNFEEIGSVNAKGNTTQRTNYGFIDNDPLMEEVSYYRLKQIDRNGKYKNSRISSINRKLSSEIGVYPNPSGDGKFILKFEGGESIFLEILDYSGKLLHRQSSENGSILDVRNFGKGLYILRALYKNKVICKKLAFN